jgi:NitT/TauT family transport system ATP-binding protein
MSEIEYRGVSKTFGDFTAVTNVTLSVKEGEIFMLLGPSGCGKTTTLEMAAGFVEPTEGDVIVDGELVEEPSPNKGVIFQETDAAIFPWKTALENVEFGLKLSKDYDAETRREIAIENLELVGLGDAIDKYPGELSGGMKQRIQMARSLALEPDVLLMDEPFGALDAQTKRVLQQELLNVWRDLETTILFVTHDIEEAILLGHRIGVFSQGPNAELKDILEVPVDYPRDITSPECSDILKRSRELIGLKEVGEVA